ncbi:FAD binding domain-containing protein [Hyphomonas johnsonii]|uniref:FAD-binding molybdopterin dehydrogenase n=1 Tax=Hyphomonas johnsonii MHS-2 TaxID=1280950 RepID=A0A059FUT1_9PROT|nr:xanthine dehydrogenase family protein subunit M [Hyphomonas johnsonii]KCZ94271.1 FAD-binding molybdopterin dehydrogenase [Hyphomonas johnsonii MHS-2]
MYPFDYHRAGNVADTLTLRASLADARFLAGGMSLLPMMKLRFASTPNIIDLRDCEELRGIEASYEVVRIGAMTRHVDVAASADVQAAIPALAKLAAGIGDPMVRARGTMGGSIANFDPAACYPAACLALGATIQTTGGDIEADEFFIGVFETALKDGELVTGAEFPIPDAAAYAKFRHPASRFALVGVFVARFGELVRVAVTGASRSGAFRWAAAEDALTESFSIRSLEGLKMDHSEMNGDIHGDNEYRAHLVEVMTRRAVLETLESAPAA